MVFNREGSRSAPEAETVLLNPLVLSRDPARETDEEGCLSFRDARGLLRGDVERSAAVRVSYVDLAGRERTTEYRGWEGRIFQHEYDHLGGRLLCDRFLPADLDRHRARLRDMEDAFVRENPGVEIRRVPAKA